MKRLIVKIGFFLLGKGLEAASMIDSEIQRDIELLPGNFTFQLKVFPNLPLLLVKKREGRLYYLGQKEEKAELTLVIKNLSTAFRLVTTQSSIAASYAESRFQLIGNASEAMVVVRCLHRVEYYLFPSLLSRRILKRQPPGGVAKQYQRLKIYSYIFFKKRGRAK